jgi:amidase
MKTSSKYSRRQFVYAGTSGMVATIVAATGRARASEPEVRVQAPPPAATAPRILRKPPLTELKRIARSYEASWMACLHRIVASISSRSQRCL